MNSDTSPDERERGVFSKLKGWIGINEYDEEYDDEDEDYRPEQKKQPVTLRLQSTRLSHVSIRQPQSLEDARLAADGLKDGRQQIVNLEKTNSEMSERIIDFLSGVTYALNGFVEKVGDRIYLFAPSNVVIDVSSDLHKSSPSLFDR